MLGSAKTDSLSAKSPRSPGIFRSIGISSNFEFTNLIAYRHEPSEIAAKLTKKKSIRIGYDQALYASQTGEFPFENPVPHVLTIPSRHHTQIQTGEKDSELTTRGRVQAQPPVPHW